MSSVNKDDLVTLEDIMDRSSLSAILDALAIICREKADHLRSEWGDPQTAKFWDRDALKVERCVKSIET